jgi:hypothetical protein
MRMHGTTPSVQVLCHPPRLLPTARGDSRQHNMGGGGMPCLL